MPTRASSTHPFCFLHLLRPTWHSRACQLQGISNGRSIRSRCSVHTPTAEASRADLGPARTSELRLATILANTGTVCVRVNVTVASTSPRVMVVKDFLSGEECRELINAARDKMAPSTVSAQGEAAKSITEQSRTSSTAWLRSASHSLAKKLYDRVSELVGIPFHKHSHVVVEDLQVLRYTLARHPEPRTLRLRDPEPRCTKLT